MPLAPFRTPALLRSLVGLLALALLAPATAQEAGRAAAREPEEELRTPVARERSTTQDRARQREMQRRDMASKQSRKPPDAREKAERAARERAVQAERAAAERRRAAEAARPASSP